MYSKFPLGKYVKVIGGYAFKSEDFSESGNPVIRISDIANGTVQINKSAKIENRKVGKGANYKIDKGDILIAMSGATTGKIGVVPDYIDCDIYQNQRVGNFKILDATKLNKRFLRYVILSPFYQREIHQTMAGAAQPNISSGQLESIEIPLPPLPEQKRIAEVLDKADALREKRRLALQKLDTLLQSVFLEMFGDLVTNSKGWEIKPLGQICDVRDGTHDSPKYVETGYPLVTSKNLSKGYLDFSEVNFISQEDFTQVNKRSKVDKGDILMPMIGTIGNPVLIEEEPNFAIKNVALIKAKENSPSNIYIKNVLAGHYFDFIVAKKNRGGTQKFISLGDIRSFPIPLPPKEAQETFESSINKIEAYKKKLSNSFAMIENLFQSLQQRAFKGELFSNEFSAIESQDEKVWQQTSLF